MPPSSLGGGGGEAGVVTAGPGTEGGCGGVVSAGGATGTVAPSMGNSCAATAAESVAWPSADATEVCRF